MEEAYKEVYYVKAKGKWGSCNVSWDNKPCYSWDETMKFETRFDALDWTFTKEAWEWIKEAGDDFEVCESFEVEQTGAAQPRMMISKFRSKI